MLFSNIEFGSSYRAEDIIEGEFGKGQYFTFTSAQMLYSFTTDEEKQIEMMRKKERNEAHLYMQLNIILEKEFYDNLGNSDLYDPTKIVATK